MRFDARSPTCNHTRAFLSVAIRYIITWLNMLLVWHTCSVVPSGTFSFSFEEYVIHIQDFYTYFFIFLFSSCFFFYPCWAIFKYQFLVLTLLPVVILWNLKLLLKYIVKNIKVFILYDYGCLSEMYCMAEQNTNHTIKLKKNIKKIIKWNWGLGNSIDKILKSKIINSEWKTTKYAPVLVITWTTKS